MAVAAFDSPLAHQPAPLAAFSLLARLVMLFGGTSSNQRAIASRDRWAGMVNPAIASIAHFYDCLSRRLADDPRSFRRSPRAVSQHQAGD